MLALVLAGSTTAALLVLGVFEDAVSGLGLQGMSVLVLLTAILLAIFIGSVTRNGVWSPPTLFFIVLALFHCGLLITPAFGGEIAEFLLGGWTGWYSAELMARAAYLIELGLLAYGAGVGYCVAFVRNRSPANSSHYSIGRDTVLAGSIVDVGAFILVASVMAWYVSSASAIGPLFFLQSYDEFRLRTLDVSLGNSYLGITLGSVFVAQDPRRPLGRIAAVVLGLFILLALAVGLRSSALIPLVAAIAVYARTHRMPSKKAFFVFVLIGLMAVSSVQQIRARGLSEFSLLEFSASPLKAVEEMGYTARTVVTTVDWHEVSGDPFRTGATYWAPIERGVASVIGVERIDAESDFRLMNVEIANRVGQIGGSIIAEAHHNFGPWGVVVISALAGALLGGAAVRPPTARVLAVSGVLMVLLLMHVRNSFAPIAAWAIAGAVALALAACLALMRERGKL